MPSQYAHGYQQALQDVAEANERGGTTAAFEWIYDNATDPAVRQLVGHLAGKPASPRPLEAPK